MSPGRDAVSGWLAAQRSRLLADLEALVRIPSVSADPARAAAMREAADWLSARLAAIGLQNVRRLAAGGHPAVYADWLQAPAAPTVLVYGHYDVQPPDPLDRWLSPPFEPTVRDGRLYARGVSDDKGPTLTALGALEAFLAVEGRLPLNVKLLLEGEEEVGSRTLSAILAAHPDLLAADVVLSADGARWRPDLAAVNVGSRGIVALELTMRTAAKDLHSGRYGGPVANPLHVMCALIASLHDARGRVAVLGFYDGVREPSAEDRAMLSAIPFDEAAFFAGLGAAPGAGEAGYSALELNWLRPTLEVNGMWGGYMGAGSKTVIPCEAHAKITCRLVAGQDPPAVARAIERHLQARCPSYAGISVAYGDHGAAAYALPPGHPALAAVEAVLAERSGRQPLRVWIGGTLPLSAMVLETLGIDTVTFSFSTADEDYHAPNEFFRLASFDEGLTAWVALLRRLGTLPVAAFAPFRRR